MKFNLDYWFLLKNILRYWADITIQILIMYFHEYNIDKSLW